MKPASKCTKYFHHLSYVLTNQANNFQHFGDLTRVLFPFLCIEPPKVSISAATKRNPGRP